MPKQIAVCGAFDDLRSGGIRFLEEASKIGELTVLLWPDVAVQRITGQAPKFPEAERLYFLNAVRYVSRARLVGAEVQADSLPVISGFRPDVWVVGDCRASAAKEAFARERGIEYHVLGGERKPGFPEPSPMPSAPGRKKVIVTGCYDWFHSGHVRFFEEVSAYGDLYVVIGHDANIRLLKGEGHPLVAQDERRYVVGSIKFVKQAILSSGEGWLDADPEVRRIQPDIYAVNEDGDKGGKREYCAARGIEYLVLRRTPAPGLPKRSSTNLRGF
jgi:cytidyltransferase-like protein